MPERSQPFTTKSGRVLSDADVEALADGAERGYDVEDLERRRRGRPMLGSAPAEGCPGSPRPELKHGVEDRARDSDASVSEIIREALRRFFDVA